MSIEIGAAYLSIVPSLRGAQKQIQAELSGIDMSAPGSAIGKQLSGAMGKSLDLSAIGTKLESVGGAISGVGTKLTNSITKPALGAVGAVGGLVTALGFKRLVGIDTARGQFKGLGHDADAVMKQVAAGVNNTALSMADGAALAVGALATGNLPLEQLEGQLKRVANVSAAYGVDASQAGYLLNNVLTKNKVTYGDLSQMVQNQIPIISMLADHYGVTGDEIEEMAQDGLISIEDLNAVLDNNAGQAAEEYAKTWKGVTSNIVSNIGKIGAKLMEPSFDRIKEQLANFLQLLKSPEFATWAEEMGVKIGEFLDRAITMGQQLIGWWNQLDDSTKKMIGGIALAAVAAGPVLQVIGGITTKIGVLVGAGGKLMGWLGALTPSVEGAAGAGGLLQSGLLRILGPVGLVITALVAMWTNSESFREAIMVLGAKLFEVGQQIMAAIAPALATIGPLFAQLATIVGDTVGMLLTALMPLIGFLLDQLVPVFTFLAETVKAVFAVIVAVVTPWMSAIQSIISAVMAAIQGDWSGAWGHIQAAVGSIWEAIKALIGGAIQLVWGIITGTLSTIQTFWSNVWAAIGSTVTAVWDGIKSGVSTAINAVSSTISGILGGIKSAWGAAWDWVKQKVSDIWDGIKSGVTNSISNVMAGVTGLKDKVIGFFANAGTWLLNAGKSIIGGLTDGISSAFGGAVDAVKAGLSRIRDYLPFSPAKKGPFSGRGYTLYSGRKLMADFARGIEDEHATVQSSLSSVLGLPLSALPGIDGTGAAPVAGADVADAALVAAIAQAVRDAFRDPSLLNALSAAVGDGASRGMTQITRRIGVY